MTSRAPIIHARASKVHSLLSGLYVFENVLWSEHCDRLRVEHFIVDDLQILRLHACSVGQEVVQVLHVNFEVIHLNFERRALTVNLLVHVGEEIENSPWNNTIHLLNILSNVLLAAFNRFNDGLRSQHAECLARATLPISKDCAIVTFRKLIYCMLGCALVHALLRLA